MHWRVILSALMLLALVGGVAVTRWSPEAAEAQSGPGDHCLAEWQWNISETDPEGIWQAPYMDRFISALDFRSVAQKSTPNDPDPGWGMFSYDRDMTGESGVICYGPDLTDTLSKSEIDAIGFIVGGFPAGTIQARTMRDGLWELATVHADATGQDFMRPLLPRHDGKLRLLLGGRVLKHVQKVGPADPEWTSIRDVYRADMRRYITQAGLGQLDRDHPRRTLGYLLRQFDLCKRDYSDCSADDIRQFVPSDLDLITPLEPRTTQTDDFDYSDGELTSVSSGVWAAGDNDFDVISGEVGPNFDSTNTAYFDTPFDTAGQMYSQVEFRAFAFNKRSGVVTSGIDDENWYQGSGQQDSGADTIDIRVYSGGTPTSFATQDCDCGDLAVGDLVKLEQDGSDFVIYVDDGGAGFNQEASGSDGTHTSLYAGIAGGDNDPQQLLDNWEGADFPAGGAASDNQAWWW